MIYYYSLKKIAKLVNFAKYKDIISGRLLNLSGRLLGVLL